MAFIAPEHGTTGVEQSHGKLDDAVALLKTSGYVDIADRLEADLAQQAEPTD